MKFCNKCGQYKETTDFHRDRSRNDGYKYVCKECECRRSKHWYEDNTEARKITLKEYYLKSKEK